MLIKRFLKASKPILKRKPALLFANCSELPLYNFIKIQVTSDLQWLVVSGEPEQAELLQAWDNIFNEYSDICPTDGKDFTLALLKDIKTYENNLHIIKMIVERLTLSYVPELCETLRLFGYNFAFTPDSMLNDLQRVVKQVKTMVVKKQLAEKEYSEYLAKQGGTEVTESDYDAMLSELSKFQGYHLRSKDLSVSEFVAILVRYKQHIKNLERGIERTN